MIDDFAINSKSSINIKFIFFKPEIFLFTDVQFIPIMGRKKGFDDRKTARIVGILIRNPDGIWLRRLAEEAELSPTTVSTYLKAIINPLIEEVSIGSCQRPLLRVIKLKPFVLEKMGEGSNINQIMKFLRMMEKISK